MRRLLPAFAIVALAAWATTALADTPAFFESVDGRTFPRNEVPTVWDAQLGTVYSYIPAGGEVIGDPTCDGLSTDVILAHTDPLIGGFEVNFTHQEEPGGHEIGELETMSLKLGQVNTDVWGAMAGFKSVTGFEVDVVQLGPAAPGSPNPELGEVYVFGQPTGLRFGNVMDSVCSGFDRMDNRVNVEFKLYGPNGVFFVVVQAFGSQPQQQTYGPFDLHESFGEGYGACFIRAGAQTGDVVFDGVECISSSVIPIDPINDDNETARESGRRRR